MNRFFKLTALFAIVASLSVLANEGFAKGGVKPSSTRKHRINRYPGINNPDANPDNPPVWTPWSPVGPIGPPKPIKPTPVKRLPPVAFPTGPAKPIL